MSKKSLLDLVHSKCEEILKGDACFQHQQAVKYGERNGLIRDLTPEEIQQRMDRKDWKKVNKVIRENDAKQHD